MKLEKRTGTISRLFYSSSGFTAGKFFDDRGVEFKFSTRFLVKVGDKIDGYGYEHIDPKYGPEFRFQKFSDDSGVIDPEGLVYYLSHHPSFKGVTAKRAKELAEKHVETLVNCLDMEAKDLAKKLQLPVETIEMIQKEFAGSRSPKAVARLCSYGISPRQAGAIVAKWGADALKVVQEDPFRLIGAIPGFAFKKTDDVARAVGIPKNHPSRIRAGILFVLDEMMDDGHTYHVKTKLVDAALELLFLDTMDSIKMVSDAIEKLVDEGVLVMSGETIQTKWMRFDEMLIAACMFDFRNRSTVVTEPARLAAPGDLNEKQLIAYFQAVDCGVSIICGAAGTGKTFTVKNIYEGLTAKGKHVALCAPTGKAAKRLEELTGYEAKTIHRLLEHDGRGFTRGANNRISYDAVIVDESSMVDTQLLASLIAATPLDAKFVFVGDPNQLPPVGPGCPFLDMIKSKQFPTTTLTEVVRQKGKLRQYSAMLLEGQVVKDSSSNDWHVIDELTDQAHCLDYVVKLYTQYIQQLGISDTADLPQVLSPMTKGILGTKNLNVIFQKIVQETIVGGFVDPTKAGKLMIGDRVIQTKNNYDLGIMNGNMGVVRKKASDGIEVLFDGEVETVFVPNDSVSDMQLAYAITVHKSQGSEFESVFFIVHKSHSIMHDRSLIYTGATRASKNLIIVGDRWGQKNSVSTQRSTSRRTALSALLMKR